MASKSQVTMWGCLAPAVPLRRTSRLLVQVVTPIAYDAVTPRSKAKVLTGTARAQMSNSETVYRSQCAGGNRTGVTSPLAADKFECSPVTSPRTANGIMCRNVRTLTNFDPPASDAEIRAAALQFVRKICGTTRPSRANDAAFNCAVDQITAAATKLVRSYTTSATPRTRAGEARKAAARNLKRFGRAGSVFDHEV